MNQYQPQPNAAVNATRPKIRFNQVPPKLNALVKGTVTYSHIRSLIDGDALAKKIADAKTRNPNAQPKTDPHFSITLSNPTILVQDPKNPNTLEVAISQRFYTTKNGVHSVGFDIVGQYCWPIAVKDPDTGQYNEIEPEGELAQGLEVILVMYSYIGKNGRGVSVSKILVPGEIRYYRSNGINDYLAQLGFPQNTTIERQLPNPNVPAQQPAPDDMGDLTLQTPPIQQYQQPMNQYVTQGTAYGQMQQAPVYNQQAPIYNQTPIQQYQQPMNQYVTQGTAYGQMQQAPVYNQQAPIYNQTPVQQYQQPVNQAPVYMQPPMEADIPTIQAQPSQPQTVAQPGITVEQNLEPVGGFDPYAAYDPNGMM